MPRGVGVRSHRFMSVVLLLAVLPIPMVLLLVVILLHRPVVLLLVLLPEHLQLTADGKARGPLFSPGERWG